MSSSISRQVLFIVEGKSDEPRLLKEMEPILSKTMGAKIRCYKAQRDIYTFFHNIDTGPDGDGVLAYLKSMKSTDSEGLLLFPEGERPETVFSSIYLIFDFDPQASLFNAQKIKELCSFFSDETENGKLLLNFPMIESLRHVLSMNPKD